MINFKRYIGIPFLDTGRTKEGADCWGLIKLIYKETIDVDIPEYYISCDDVTCIAETVDRDLKTKWERQVNPEPLDVVTFKGLVEGMPFLITHVGIYIGDNKLIHAVRDNTSAAVRTDRGFWAGRIEGFYRWKG